ncbi:MAG: aspartyl protease family protein [Treponema sp.]|jgi:clan AA aspartic protease|nr:aspartyl protease family protein [Treponema sp.]
MGGKWGFADRGYIKEDEVRVLEVEAMPDTGAWTLIINDEVRNRLGLKTFKTVESSVANGEKAQYDLTEPVEIRWKNRQTIQQTVVIPNAPDILLGAIPLEGMDLYVDPVNKQLAGVHGDIPVYVVYKIEKAHELVSAYHAVPH